MSGKLTMLVGCMFAGKTTSLLTQGVRHKLAGQELIYLKPQVDNRYSKDEIVTHDGVAVKANVVAPDEDILTIKGMEQADVVLIDEIQFFPKEFIEDVEYLVNVLGKTVYCSGLDIDYRGEPFPVTAHLLAVADSVSKLKAVCADCGGDAYISSRTVQIKGKVVLGSKDIYKPTCRKCCKQYLESI